MRLIDADALEHEFMSNMHYLTKDMVMDAAYKVNKAPTIDAVPVVRCKDCYHRTHDGSGKPYCLALEMYLNKELDFFCSYGERKDGEG